MKKQRKTVPTKNAAQTLTPDQQGMLADLVQSVREAEAIEADHSATYWSGVVRRLATALAGGIQRKTIAPALGYTTGSLSRLVLLSKNADTPVTVDGREYPGTVAALQSGTITVRGLYDLLAPDKASKTNGGKTATSFKAAVLALTARHVRYKNARESKTLTMLESREDWLKSLAVLLAHKIGKLDPTVQEAILEMIPTTDAVAAVLAEPGAVAA